MGCMWKTMALLSTLAALVIIVHSAEEDLNIDRSLEVRPRSIDGDTSTYDQAWRELDVKPLPQSTNPDNWRDVPEDPPKRRRPVRKRKRRPANYDEANTQERYTTVQPEENPRHGSDYNVGQKTDGQRRRRKKPENRRNRRPEAQSEDEEPLQRRNLKKKRPSVDNWADQREFSNFRAAQLATALEQAPLSLEDDRHFNNDDKETSNDPSEQIIPFPATLFKSDEKVRLREDISLSDVSMDDAEITIPIKENKKAPILDEANKSMVTGPIDPATLKDILKRSNGASLSEILQKNNLSLADLLHGSENAISLLKAVDSLQESNKNIEATVLVGEPLHSPENVEFKESESKQAKQNINLETKVTVNTYNNITKVVTSNNENKNIPEKDNSEHVETNQSSQETLEVRENAPKLTPRRRFPGTVRRKLRMRPLANNTNKTQSNREIISITARKYLQHRNNSKPRDWKHLLPMILNTSVVNEDNTKNVGTGAAIETTTISDLTTTELDSGYKDQLTQLTDAIMQRKSKIDEEESTQTIQSLSNKEVSVTEIVNTTEKPKVTRFSRPTANAIGLRRQAFTTVIKKKRLKQKNLTTETSGVADDIRTDIFGMPSLVSSSEFIARTLAPSTTPKKDSDDFTVLEDFMTTDLNIPESEMTETTENSTTICTTTSKTTPISTTEEVAKFEIEEILNDTRTSARLSKILMERNMTLNELVEHRERGSSHIHLADIFHNASREPNPPEPFLSKSLIEPISRETYPLRALLENNLHDPTAKATTIDPNKPQYNIPVVMDFGNNVNENGENRGIISLFNKFSETEVEGGQSRLGEDSEGIPDITTLLNDANNGNITREGRKLTHNNQDNSNSDVVNWNELFDLMQKNYDNQTKRVPQQPQDVPEFESEVNTKKLMEDDLDTDGLILVQDLEHLKDLDNKIASAFQENVEVPSRETGFLGNFPSSTKSVTVATASIVGLAMILFLLTYAIFKWKQQRKQMKKKQSFTGERIPTPVFEHRKGHKNNCSTRSMSPMLASSNIYTMNTLESRNGNDSPDYMWDSLRKPFQ